MKKITLLLGLVGMMSLAQTKGNKEISTQFFPLENLEVLEMELYAQVTVDVSGTTSGITITGDSNLIPLIDTEVVGGKLKLAQTEWIQPSQALQITIQAPQLERLQVGVHETVQVKNLDQKQIVLTALLGGITASGIVTDLAVNAEAGLIDASSLTATNAQVNIWKDGKAILNVEERVTTKLSDEARLDFVRQPKEIKGSGYNKAMANVQPATDGSGKYISIKIKNNSWNRHHFAVRGPKPDGSYFGYGFPMMPGSVKKENWTVGTKVYKKNALGMRKLLITLTEEDAGKTIELFD